MHLGLRACNEERAYIDKSGTNQSVAPNVSALSISVHSRPNKKAMLNANSTVAV